MAPGPASYVGLPGDAVEEEKTFSRTLEMCAPETWLKQHESKLRLLAKWPAARLGLGFGLRHLGLRCLDQERLVFFVGAPAEPPRLCRSSGGPCTPRRQDLQDTPRQRTYAAPVRNAGDGSLTACTLCPNTNRSFLFPPTCTGFWLHPGYTSSCTSSIDRRLVYASAIHVMGLTYVCTA